MKQNIRGSVQDKDLRAQGSSWEGWEAGQGLTVSGTQCHMCSSTPFPHPCLWELTELGNPWGCDTEPLPHWHRCAWAAAAAACPRDSRVSAPSLLPHGGLNRTSVWPWCSPPLVLVLWGSFHCTKEICSYKKTNFRADSLQYESDLQTSKLICVPLMV